MRISKTFFAAMRASISSCYTQMRNSLTLTGWVMLGLGLISLLVAILASSPGWFGPIFFGPKTDALLLNKQVPALPATDKAIQMISITNAGGLFSILLPVITTLLLYMLITLVQPRLFPWPQRRIPYLLVFTALSLLTGLFIVPAFFSKEDGLFQVCLILYAFVAHARVGLNSHKKSSLLVEGIVLCIVLLMLATFHPQSSTFSMSSESSVSSASSMSSHIGKTLGYGRVNYQFTNTNQLILRIPLLGIQIGGTLQWFQAIIWLIGLLCLHIFTGLGVHEREARRRSDQLVKELTLAQEQLRAYALHAEELATMRERTRVAREVHDTLAQGLAAIKMHLETGSKVFHETPDQSQKHIERARELAGEYLQETRNSILALRSAALDGRTLPSALSTLVAAWRPAAGTHSTTFCVSGIEEEATFWQILSPGIELACYRVVQEALSNATRHGQARHIDVELSIEQKQLCLTVTDDGLGFDPSPLAPCPMQGGFGIIGMHERLQQLGGRLEIISAPGAGTQVVAMIPLRTAQSEGVHRAEALRSDAR
jgi:signal transduction histidine kinase